MKHLILGAGNMVEALMPGYIESAKSEGHEFYIYTPSKSRAMAFAKSHFINGIEDIQEVIDIGFDFLWPAMKPQLFEAAMKEYIDLGFNFSKSVVISMMAGKEINALKSVTKSSSVIRLMPNTPSSVGEGVNLIYSDMDPKDVKSHMSFFDNVAKNFFLVSEDQIDQLTPFSGSGPAYFFEFSRIFEEKIKSFGVDERVARELVARTMRGSSKMLMESSLSSKTLRENVTSKGGVTYEALKVYSDNDLEEIFSKAIDHAILRNDQLKGDSK